MHDLARDPRAGLCIALEEGQTEMGSRPYRQISVRGYAHVQPDAGMVYCLLQKRSSVRKDKHPGWEDFTRE